jgi:putative inorganic carbon (HCO3(-)) transporter
VGHAFFFLLFLTIAAVALVRPWIGVVAAYGTVVLQPQAVWWWDFGGIRPDFWVLVPTALGIVIGVATKQLDLRTLQNKRNLYILVLWVCVIASYFFGPYVHVINKWRVFDSAKMLGIVNNMMLLYFMAAICIDSERKLMTLFYIVCGSAAYLVYWCNAQYFIHHVVGRIEGPQDVHGQGIYHDQNAFAMLFVVAQSFFWYLGLSQKRPLWRWAIWLIIPFSWNAVFLTASRGGLVGLGVAVLLIALRSKYKLFKYALIPAFVFVFVWEGGGLMKSRAETIGHYQSESSAETRIQAWHAAVRAIEDHPFSGVGIASFIVAFPNYSEDQPREAHDTFLQITAESGVLAGVMYLLTVINLLMSLSRIVKERAALVREPERDPLCLTSEVTIVAFAGLVTCSLFLSMQVFEIFYCLNVMANAVVYINRERFSGASELSSERLLPAPSGVVRR